MTMTREAKSSHQLELRIARQNSGFTAEEFGKPELRRAARAERGHAMMPASDYRAERMGRKPSTTTRRDVAVERVRARRAR
jgi:hypothetical protein